LENGAFADDYIIPARNPDLSLETHGWVYNYNLVKSYTIYAGSCKVETFTEDVPLKELFNNDSTFLGKLEAKYRAKRMEERRVRLEKEEEIKRSGEEIAQRNAEIARKELEKVKEVK